jgi:lactate dehydrogenase-like 2-hydroxyacid dehydrogenase
MMKRGMRVVNVGRGKCIDESALAVAIEDGIVAGAGLDVFYDE